MADARSNHNQHDRRHGTPKHAALNPGAAALAKKMVQLTARPKEQGFLAGSLLLLSELLMNRVAMDLASSVPLLEGELTAGCDDNVLDQPLGRRLQAGSATRHHTLLFCRSVPT